MPRATVILNSYNQNAYLGAAVESVLAQTCSDFQLLAIDNGSTDGSQATLEGYASDPRVELHLQSSNQAISKRFNQGVQLARAPFVSFLYSDDLLLPHKLELQLAEFDRRGSRCGVVYGPVIGLNERTGERWQWPSPGVSGQVFEELLRRSPQGQIDMITPMFRRELLIEEPFDESLFAEGEAIVFRLALRCEFGYRDEPVAVARDHGANAGKAITINREMFEGSLRAVREHPKLLPSQRRSVDRYEARTLRAWAWQAMRLGGDPDWARDCLKRALQLDARSTLHPKAAAALALTAMPEGLRARVNSLGYRWRASPETLTLVSEYEGLGSATSAEDPRVSCHLCGGSTHGGRAYPYRRSWRGRDYRYRRCARCGAVLLVPRPSEPELREAFHWDAYDRRRDAVDPGARHARALALIEARLPAGARILDVGSGSGAFLESATRRGHRCTGIEYESSTIEALRARGLDVDTLDEVEQRGGRYEAIHLSDVLPHVRDPRSLLARLQRLLEPGGVVVVDQALEANRSLVLAAAALARRARAPFGPAPVEGAPTTLARLDLRSFRRLCELELGWRREHEELSETGWPYRAADGPGGTRTSPPKRAIAAAAAALASTAAGRRLELGNRVLAVYSPVDGDGGPDG